MADLSYEELDSLFNIDEDGILYWKVRKQGRSIVGIAGSITSDGYWQVGINRKRYQSHRIAYILHNKKSIPEGLHIDHIDRNKLNNRKDNLRVVTHRQNHNNRTNQAIYPNLQKRSSGNYLIHFRINGKKRHFGTYPLNDAIAIRDKIIADFENICKKYA